MSIRVVSTVYPCTLQDAGRFGFRSYGMPVSGPMDPFSFRLANILCGNQPEEIALEITLHGLALCFEADALVAICGGGSIPYVGDLPLPLNRPILIRRGNVLLFKPNQLGCRMYLAVSGGFASDGILESSSTYAPAGIGGNEGRVLRKGDLLKPNSAGTIAQAIKSELDIETASVVPARWGFASFLQELAEPSIVRYLDGLEWNEFDEDSQRAFQTSTYSLSDRSDRMGYQLTGPLLRLKSSSEMLSAGVCPGTVQVTHSGILILLMADGQTTGGYPRVAQVITADLPLCGQFRPGSVFRFHRVTHQEAEDAFFEQADLLTTVSQAVKLRFGI